MLYAIIGATFSGKTTLLKEFSKIGFEKIVTHTSRPMRKNEIDGIDYFFEAAFVKDEDVLAPRTYQAINNDNEIEEWTYWIDAKDINKTKQQMVIIDPEGAEELQKNIDDDFEIIMLLPDQEVIEERMITSSRSGENINESMRRLKSDMKSIHNFLFKISESKNPIPITFLFEDSTEKNLNSFLKQMKGDKNCG